jgi:crotonobetainyl-CoA:carnitine CoA-transferase CaiB-like acyl-CoA transferase
MLESILDFQFEVLTSYFNDGRQLPVRSEVNNGNAYIAAPYGIYQTREGYLALAMGNVQELGRLLDCPALAVFSDPAGWFDRRDEIKGILAGHLMGESAGHWLTILRPADVWCAKVMNYEDLIGERGYKELDMEIRVKTSNGLSVTTTRCPIRVDGEIARSEKGAPLLGEHNEEIERQFALNLPVYGSGYY